MPPSVLDRLPVNELVSRSKLRCEFKDDELKQAMAEWLERRCRHPTVYQYQSLLYVNVLLCEKELDRRSGTKMYSTTLDVTYSQDWLDRSLRPAAARANYWVQLEQCDMCRNLQYPTSYIVRYATVVYN